jgi:excisionase family DNA binding protein
MDSAYMDRSSTIADFCGRHNISRPTFYELVRSGQLEALKLGSKTIVTAEAERAFLAKLPRLFADTSAAA